MRTRAYRPEVPVCLESRSLLSVAAGHPADPVVLTRRQLNYIAARIREGFQLFGRYGNVDQARREILDDTVVLIPFEKVDGLAAKVDRIVSRMQHDLLAHVPNAVRTAQTDVLAAARAEVMARVRTGDVVLR